MRYARCPICGNERVQKCFLLPNIPVFVNSLSDSAEKAKNAMHGTQNLVQCCYCGFVFNCNFEADKMAYDGHYHNERGCSAYYRQHMRSVLDLIETAKPIKNQHILEVACGNGEFLREAVGRSPQSAVGVDPSVSAASDGILDLHPVFFDDTYLRGMDKPVDLLINRHMIEHVLNPLEMLKRFHKGLAEDGILYLETPRLDWILENKAFFDFPYEHCAYYLDSFMIRLLSTVGFEVIALENSYDGQYFSICARKGKAHFPIDAAGEGELLQTQELFAALECVYSTANRAERVQDFCTEISVPHISGTDFTAVTQSGLYLWGASAKGVMCANLLDKWPIAGIIDENPHKQGKFVPGTGHQVLTPSEIAYETVKTVFVENDVYFSEIQSVLQKIDPRISIYSLNHFLGRDLT